MEDDRPQEIIDKHTALLKLGYQAAIQLDEDIWKHCFIAPDNTQLPLADYESAVRMAYHYAQERALLSELRRLVNKYHAALAQEKLAPSQLNFEITSVREEIANAVLKGLGE